MILRRIVDSLRKQDWASVTIEVLIVVLGVFIGLQVNEWGAAQDAQRRGRAYVERLIHDVEHDLEARRQLVAYYDAVNDSAERANAMLGQASSDPAALVISAYRATEYAYAPPTRSTWDEIVSSGDVALLPRAAVEGGLSDYFASDVARSVVEEMRASAYRQRVRSIISHDVQKAIREGCGDVRDANQRIIRFREDCRLNVSAEALAGDAAALRRDPSVASDLRYQFSEITTARANLRGDVAHLEHALAGLRRSQRR